MSKNLDYKIIEIDNLISILILENTLFYEEVEPSGNLLEIEIPISEIKSISFTDKNIKSENNGCNLLFNLFHFADDYQTPYTEDYRNQNTINPYITIKYNTSNKTKVLKISSNSLTKNKFIELQREIQL